MDRLKLAVKTLLFSVLSVLSLSFGAHAAAQQSGQNWDRQDSPLSSNYWANNPLVLRGHARSVISAEFSADGRWVVTGSLDRTARVWDLRDGQVVSVTAASQEAVNKVYFSPDGQLVYTGFLEGAPHRIWNASSGDLVATLKGHDFPVTADALSLNGELLVTGAYDGDVRVWDARNGELIVSFKAQHTMFTDLAISPNGTTVVTGSSVKQARLWRVSRKEIWNDGPTVRPLASLEGHEDLISSVDISIDGQFAVTGSWDGTARIWDAKDGELLFLLDGHSGAVHDVRFSPTSRFHSEDRRIFVVSEGEVFPWVWNAENGALIAPPREYVGSALYSNLSRNGRLLVTYSRSSPTARLWDVEDGRLIATLSGHSGGIRSAEFSRNGRLLAIGSKDGTVRIWGQE